MITFGTAERVNRVREAGPSEALKEMAVGRQSPTTEFLHTTGSVLLHPVRPSAEKRALYCTSNNLRKFSNSPVIRS
jgi:hypothetical protein